MGNQLCCKDTAKLPDEAEGSTLKETAVSSDAGKNLAPIEQEEESLPQFPPEQKQEEATVAPKSEEPPQAAPKAAEAPNAPSTEQPGQVEQPQLPFMDKTWQDYLSGDMVAKEKAFFADKDSGAPRRPSTLGGISFQDYAQQHADVFDKVKTLVESDGWVLKKTVDSVDIFTKSVAGSDMIATKGTTLMKTYGNGIRHLVAHMLTAEDRPQYDEVCNLGQTVESYLPHYRTLYFQIKPPAAIIAPRDVLTLSRLRFETDGTLVIATESTDHPSLPEKSSHVRTKIVGGYVISPTSDPDEYRVTFCVQADPQGWLPGWVKNMVAWKLQLVLAHYKKHYQEVHGKGK